MDSKRNCDRGYYYSLSDELKEKDKNVLRFERRIQWAKALRKRLHTEYQHAIREELLYKWKFGVSLPHLALSIGFTMKDVVNAINEL